MVDYKTGKAPEMKYSEATNQRIMDEKFFQLQVTKTSKQHKVHCNGLFDVRLVIFVSWLWDDAVIRAHLRVLNTVARLSGSNCVLVEDSKWVGVVDLVKADWR